MKIRFLGLLLLLFLAVVGRYHVRAQEQTDAAKPTPTPAAETATEKPADPAPAEEAPPEPPKSAEETPAPAEETEPAKPADAKSEGKDAASADDESVVAPSPTEEGSAAEDADTSDLPMPTEENLGEPMDQEGLPAAEEGADLPNPDDLLPGDVYSGQGETAPPPPEIKENKFEQERRLAVRYQEVKLQALKNQSIRDMRAKADEATTDEAKRQALREYYKMLFAKMVSLAPELEEKCNTMETAYLRRVGQYRVMPTIPLNPPPTPEPLPGRAEGSKPASSENEDEG